MSRLLYRLSYPASASARAPMRNRTADLLLTMETLYRLSYRGTSTFVDSGATSAAPTPKDTQRQPWMRIRDPADRGTPGRSIRTESPRGRVRCALTPRRYDMGRLVGTAPSPVSQFQE